MIVIFHLLSNLFYNLCKRRINARNSTWSNFTLTKLNLNDHPLAQRDAENDIKFDPPMYKQRYERAVDVLTHEKWKEQITKVVDFGCSEFGLFVFLKNRIEAKELLFVDIDELTLREYLYRVYPINADYLLRRKNSLKVKVFTGSCSYPDSNLINIDAVIALEIIEHLYPDTLDALPYNWFSYVCPKLVIVTTPNSDFNVLFKNFGEFRHPDHKFEWSREQFKSWATNITLRFPRYTVLFDGIGLGPVGSENFGCCSQLAVFIRKDLICDNYVEEVITCTCTLSTCKANSQDSHCCLCKCKNCIPIHSYGVCTYSSYTQKHNSDDILESNMRDDSYKLIATADYPRNVDTRTDEQKLHDELNYRINQFGSKEDEFYNFERNRVEVPLKCLLYSTPKFSPSESSVRSILLKSNYQIEECLNQETNQLEPCVIYEFEMESGASGSDAEASGYESDKYHSDDGQLSDWNDKDMTPWDDVVDKDSEKPLSRKDVKTELHLEVSTSKKQQEALIDSGYQKSPSATDESPQSLPKANKDAIPLEYKSLNTEKPNKLSNILSVFDNFDKINELDAIRKDRKYFNFSSNLPHREVMRKICQEIARHPVAGPSRDPRRSKNARRSQSSDSDESVEDVKSITTCILENSLNKIECKDDEPQRGDLIQELIPEELPPEQNQARQEEHDQVIVLVENGDLANNNRDVEGNNYPADNVENPQPENDNAIDNLDHNNVNIDNNNEVAVVVPEEAVLEEIEENMELDPIDIEVAWSSREALFDINSQVDLLEEFDVVASVAIVNNVAGAVNSAVITDGSPAAEEAVLTPEESGFPNWLLQIFEEGEVGVPEDELHDEPHFYCQGDGLGVHPSTVALDEDADDEGNGSSSESSGSSSSSSSSHGSADFANAENDSVQEIMPPAAPRNEDLVVVGQQLGIAAQSNDEPQDDDETFQSAESSESNLVAS